MEPHEDPGEEALKEQQVQRSWGLFFGGTEASIATA